MYSRLPYFVYGFHGCDVSVKEKVLFRGEELDPSRNDYDWLGQGVYFWEQNYSRAFEFAEKAARNPEKKYTNRPIKQPAVIGAIIDLGYCLNLMDSSHIQLLGSAYELLKSITVSTGKELPKNGGAYPDKPLRRLDRAVIELLHIQIGEAGLTPYDTVRAMFLEGNDIYDGAGFKEQTHIHICVRNVNCIKAYFDPRDRKPNGFLV